MPLLDFRQARAELRLGEVLQLLGWTARARRGAQVRGACPVHRSESATSRVFSAHLERGVWQCFRCGAAGNALELWARVTGQGIYQAVRDLYRRLGRALPWLPPARRKQSGAIRNEASRACRGAGRPN
jgi:DNA primase